MEKHNADNGFMAFVRLDGEATFQLTHLLFRRCWEGVMKRKKAFPWSLDLNGVCDQCGKSRAHGDHQRCSKARQLAAAQRGIEEARTGKPSARRRSAGLFWLLRQD